ncbi:hypothetical protein EV193_11419 [Herbihabitans rhizosphaerae]|uniref:Ribbon-helix-helix CopG family protein n=1 Tax=Herbihabitans rhizosphaerae TaxID=1872711 RepID=A0A4Q7KEP8_9PSEU|nr:hypothetical protein [Herbihabitans rhizosphaerae]RZS31330.1 hypothetical protein EV193_11419 [Herbihabitans rhizosphaerae]
MSSVNFRPDEATERALAELTADGRSVSAAIRDAVLDAARAKRAEALRAEALALAADPDDVAEMRAVRADLEPLRAW